MIHSSSWLQITSLKNKLVDIEKSCIIPTKRQNSYKKIEQPQSTKIIQNTFFSFAKKKSKKYTKIGPLIDENKNYITDSKEMADTLQKQYMSVFSNPYIETDSSECNNKNYPHINYLEDIVFVRIMVSHQKWWKQAINTHTPGGDQGKAENYRPVLLTSHLVKAFEKVVCKYIVKYIEENNFFNETQHGFWSCLSQLLHFNTILMHLEDDKNVDTIYLDFSKAFNKVDYKILLKELQKLKIKANFWNGLSPF